METTGEGGEREKLNIVLECFNGITKQLQRRKTFCKRLIYHIYQTPILSQMEKSPEFM